MKTVKYSVNMYLSYFAVDTNIAAAFKKSAQFLISKKRKIEGNQK